jgi:hypothetical protein
VGYLRELRKSQMERRTFKSILGFFSSLLEGWVMKLRLILGIAIVAVLVVAGFAFRLH